MQTWALLVECLFVLDAEKRTLAREGVRQLWVGVVISDQGKPH